jgi:hypothetical protein
MPTTLRDLSIKYALTQNEQVDNLLEDSPVLARIPFKRATHVMSNVYNELTGVTGASFVDMNANLPSLSYDSKLQTVDLKVMGGKYEVLEDTARAYGGASAYFADRMPEILKATGQSTEQAIVYDNWKKYITDTHTTADPMYYSAAGTGDATTSIFFVRFDNSTNTGLYSPEGFADGALLPWNWYHNGGIYQSLETATLGKNVYGGYMKNYFGYQIASKKVLKAIVNVTSAKLPSKTQMADALNGVRAGANTIIVMNKAVLGWLGATYKSELVTYQPSETGYNDVIASWNGIPIVTSYNIKMDETAI